MRVDICGSLSDWWGNVCSGGLKGVAYDEIQGPIAASLILQVALVAASLDAQVAHVAASLQSTRTIII